MKLEALAALCGCPEVLDVLMRGCLRAVRIFGPNIELDLDYDAEIGKIIAYIVTSLPSKEAVRMLAQFDDEFTLAEQPNLRCGNMVLFHIAWKED